MCVSVCLSACDGWVCGTKFASGCCFCKENAFKQIFFCTLTTISRRKRVGARPHVRGGVGRGVAEARGGGGRGRRGSGPAGPGGRNGGGGGGGPGEGAPVRDRASLPLLPDNWSINRRSLCNETKVYFRFSNLCSKVLQLSVILKGIGNNTEWVATTVT